ncbi:alpha/beta hydrolase [Paraburkholderia terrae]
MESIFTGEAPCNFVVSHPLDADDAAVTEAIRAASRSTKGARWGIDRRVAFDLMMENISPRDDVMFEHDTVGGIEGLWVHPDNCRSDEAILHLHGGWFSFGSAVAFRHFVGHIAARAGASAFIPDYRLAPEDPFPAAVHDVLDCYEGLDAKGIRRIAVTGDSAGGNLALVLASHVASSAVTSRAALVAVAGFSPVTDLTLAGTTYETRADAEPFFTRSQVAELVRAYLSDADPSDALASPLHGRFSGLPPVRIHVGDDEVLLDDACRYVERAVAAGVDARLDVWMGMPHGFAGSVGKLNAASQALDAVGAFLAEKLQANTTLRAAR